MFFIGVRADWMAVSHLWSGGGHFQPGLQSAVTTAWRQSSSHYDCFWGDESFPLISCSWSLWWYFKFLDNVCDIVMLIIKKLLFLRY